MELDGKRVLLSGATGGLGNAIATELAANGAELVLSSRRREELQELARSLPGGADRHTVIVADLATDEAASRLVRDAGDLDVLVANAALPGTGRLDSFTSEEVARALRVNLEAPIMMARELEPHFAKKRSGHIVFIASLAGKVGSPRSSIYNATKFGLRGFAFGLREDLHPYGAGVSLVSPGFVREAGMFHDAGSREPPGLGTTTPKKVGAGGGQGDPQGQAGDHRGPAPAALRQRDRLPPPGRRLADPAQRRGRPDRRRARRGAVRKALAGAPGGVYPGSLARRATGAKGKDSKGTESGMRKLVVAAVALGALWMAPGAEAAIDDVFGGTVTCTLQADNDRICGNTAPRSTAETWDGLPIDVNVAFPADDGGPDGNYPLIMSFHGYGGSKLSFSSFERFLDRGYAVFSMTDRGFHQSCGTQQARDDSLTDTLPGDCTDGYIRLLDTRYEVRDAQYFAGRLADEELIDPQRIGSVGGSYGGGMSMSLGALKDRTMLPNGTLVPWTSPGDGDAMRIAAATPNIPWTDLVYSLVPNGGTLDYVSDAPYQGRFGVMKNSLVEGLYATGSVTGDYAPPGYRPRRRPGRAGSTGCARASPTTATRWSPTSSKSSPPTTPPTTSTTPSRPRRC